MHTVGVPQFGGGVSEQWDRLIGRSRLIYLGIFVQFLSR